MSSPCSEPSGSSPKESLQIARSRSRNKTPEKKTTQEGVGEGVTIDFSKYIKPEHMSAHYVPPAQHRSLRACMVCSIVQTASVSCKLPNRLRIPITLSYTRNSRLQAVRTANLSLVSKEIPTASQSALHKSLRVSYLWLIRRSRGLPAGRE
jgi:hypothetical protein